MRKILVGMIAGLLVLQTVPVKGQAVVGTESKVSSYSAASNLQGWKSVNGAWYYYTNGKKHTGWLSNGGSWYYLDSNGVMKTGWQLVSGKWYFMNKSGAMQTGWLNTGGKWYYLNSDGAMAKGWKSVGGQWYYLDGSGAMQTGWLKEGSTWYYLKSNGAMQTSWLLNGGEWYYLNPNGSMATDWLAVGGNYYYFFGNGVMAKDTIIDGYIIDETGIWTGEMVPTEPFELPETVLDVLSANGFDLEFTEYGWYEFYYGDEWAGSIGIDFVTGFYNYLDVTMSIAEELTGEDLYDATYTAWEEEREQIVGDVTIFPYRDIRMINYVW